MPVEDLDEYKSWNAALERLERAGKSYFDAIENELGANIQTARLREYQSALAEMELVGGTI
jgi:hypothetical protein